MSKVGRQFGKTKQQKTAKSEAAAKPVKATKAEQQQQKQTGEINPEEIYTNRHTVFLDILAFKVRVEQSVENLALRRAMYNVLHVNHTDEREKLFAKRLKNQDGSVTPPSDMRSTAFSDSVVISFDAASESETILLYLCDWLCKLNQAGWFFRGGISSGQLFHEGNVIFGPAMNKAYDLENYAVYPRIVVDPDLVYQFNPTIRFTAPNKKAKGGAEVPVYNFHPIIQDITDGAWILNVADYALANAHTEVANELYLVSQGTDCSDEQFKFWRNWPLRVKVMVETFLKECKLDSREYRKYLWYASHFNQNYCNPNNNPIITKVSPSPGPIRKPDDGSVTNRYVFGAPIAGVPFPTPTKK